MFWIAFLVFDGSQLSVYGMNSPITLLCRPFWLAYETRRIPLNLAYNTDKRRYIRYELLDYAVMSLDGTTETVNVVITDSGLGGVQVRTRTQLISGSKVFIQVACTDGESLSLRGEIRHTVEIPNSDLFSAGVRFVPENHEERMAVAEFVHQVFQRQADDLAS